MPSAGGSAMFARYREPTQGSIGGSYVGRRPLFSRAKVLIDSDRGKSMKTFSGENNLAFLAPLGCAVVPRQTRQREGGNVSDEDQEPAAKKERPTRLSVNINRETVEALKEITDNHDISYTEAIRRAVAVYKLIDDETRQGSRVKIENGRQIREVLLIT